MVHGFARLAVFHFSRLCFILVRKGTYIYIISEISAHSLTHKYFISDESHLKSPALTIDGRHALELAAASDLCQLTLYPQVWENNSITSRRTWVEDAGSETRQRMSPTQRKGLHSLNVCLFSYRYC